MLKKIKLMLGIFCFSFLFAAMPLFFSNSFGADFTSLNIQFSQSSSDKSFYTLTIKNVLPGEITKKNDISFILPKSLAIQWATTKNSNIILSGNASHKVGPVPVISNDLYVLTLEVLEEFEEGDEISIDGLTPITYRRSVSARNLGLDITGDKNADIYNIASFSVKDVTRSDFTAPFTPTDLKAEYNSATKEVKISWINPPDWDWQWTAVDRQKTVGTTKTRVEIYKGIELSFTDKNINENDVIRYLVYAADASGNVSQSFGIDLTTKTNSAPAAVVVTPAASPVVDTTTTTKEEAEKTELAKYINYYDLRYQIKCLATGVDASDDMCLLSKVDLLYAQEKLNQVKAVISLTAEEISLISSRIKWADLRYKNQCTDATTPANFCQSLKDGIQKAYYFINKK